MAPGALRLADKIGCIRWWCCPVLWLLGGRAMEIVHDEEPGVT